jgi:triosephosphate isomerase
MEPPELIGGDVSVTTRPDVVKNTLALIREASDSVVPLIGAGVKNSVHLSDALSMGSHGVLLASGVAKSPNPGMVLEEMAKVLQSKMDLSRS